MAISGRRRLTTIARETSAPPLRDRARARRFNARTIGISKSPERSLYCQNAPLGDDDASHSSPHFPCCHALTGRGNEGSYHKGHEDREGNQSTKHFIPSFSLLTLKYINSPLYRTGCVKSTTDDVIGQIVKLHLRACRVLRGVYLPPAHPFRHQWRNGRVQRAGANDVPLEKPWLARSVATHGSPITSWVDYAASHVSGPV